MDRLNLQAFQLDNLQLQQNVPLARYTSARVGGTADWLVEVSSVDELAQAAGELWAQQIPFLVFGGGSNVLVSDAGVRQVVILNHARAVRFEEDKQPPRVWAESGANFGLVARQAAQRGFTGLEWAAGIPGTVGGAVAGNAGAHGGDTAGSLLVAEILHFEGQRSARKIWTTEQFEYAYRTSILKRYPGRVVVLDARLRLERSTPEAVGAKLDELVAFRRRTQPPGASMGSMFKNPPGDYAGRLIETAGLKGTRVGGAEISRLHANFFVNDGQATARQVYDLIQLARQTVFERTGVELELEIELVGSWDELS